MGIIKNGNARFRLYSIEVSIEGEGAVALAGDFEFFAGHAQRGKAAYRLRLQCEDRAPAAADLPDRVAERVFPTCVLYRDGADYVYEYPGAILRVQKGRSQSSATLIGQDHALRREIAYLYLQSEIGRFLDAQGLHRIHALGLGLPSGKAALLLLPSGGGKSTMALEILQSENCVLLSDDSPLIDRKGNVHPFPLRLGFRPQAQLPESWRQNAELFERRQHGPKILVPMKALPRTVIPAPNAVFKPGFLIVGQRHGRNLSPSLEKMGRHRGALPLFRDLVVGLGIAQVAELVLAGGLKSLPGLAPTALSRAKAAATYAAKATTLRFHMSRDSRKDARYLLAEITNI